MDEDPVTAETARETLGGSTLRRRIENETDDIATATRVEMIKRGYVTPTGLKVSNKGNKTLEESDEDDLEDNDNLEREPSTLKRSRRILDDEDDEEDY